MKRIRTTIIILSALVGAPLVLFLVLHMLSGPKIAFEKGARHLISLRAAWLRDGSPPTFDVGKYTVAQTRTRTTFADTNVFNVQGTNHPSLIGMTEEMLGSNGYLAITRDGILMWVDHQKEPRVLPWPKGITADP